MRSYTVEYMTRVYVSIPVEANSREEAEALADKMLTRHSVWAEVSDSLPENTAASVAGKDWELNRDIDEDDEDDEDESSEPLSLPSNPEDLVTSESRAYVAHVLDEMARQRRQGADLL